MDGCARNGRWDKHIHAGGTVGRCIAEVWASDNVPENVPW